MSLVQTAAAEDEEDAQAAMAAEAIWCKERKVGGGDQADSSAAQAAWVDTVAGLVPR